MKRGLFALLGFVLIVGFVFVACDTSTSGDKIDPAIVGKWEKDGENWSISFYADGTAEDMNYTASNGVLTFLSKEGSASGSYKISSNKLTLSGFDDNFGINGTYTKIVE